MKNLILIFILLIPTSIHAQELNDNWIVHTAIGTYMTLNGVDLSETMYLLGSKNGVEANPVFAPWSNKPALFGAAKMSIDTLASYGIIAIHKDHPKLALILSIIGISAEGWVSVHNYKLIPKS